MQTARYFITLLLLGPASLLAQNVATGTVSGTIFDQATNRPAESVTVALKKTAGGGIVGTTITDKQGGFLLENVAPGEYQVAYSYVGFDREESAPFAVNAQHRATDLGRLSLAGSSALKMEQVQVSARQAAFENSIDRKVYNVGKEIQSVAGSTSDLLQNIPSVQVDIEGNVSLRGDENVLILINGKSSVLMGANRAAALEQMPADAIERIEVITNPSAKYKPDGTAGIINIVMKKKQVAGYSGSLRATVGNARRYSVGLSGNYNPGKYNLSGSYSIRQDDRVRFTEDQRQHLDPASNAFLGTRQRTSEISRPLSHILQAGLDYTVDDKTKLGISSTFNHRDFFRTATQANQSTDSAGLVISDYDRRRTDPEFEQDLESRAYLQHAFAEEGRELNLELKHGESKEKEDNRYVNTYRTPFAVPSFDNQLLRNDNLNTEVVAEYVHPLKNDAKLEAGLSREDNKLDMDHLASSLDPATNTFVPDPTVTNRFIYESVIDALYATYGRPMGKFGLLAGLRLEQAAIDTNQVTARIAGRNTYARLYPSLHLSYNLTDDHQLQFNYSHRVHRPEGDDLNPYPQYSDPFNLRAGNPHLLPEEIHSIEAGYQYKKDETSYLATVYYRYQYHGLTDVTQYINSTTLLTTKQNLAVSRSGGLELAATTSLGSKVSFNFSSNAFYNEIDASNLGFAARKSTVAWNAKLNANVHVSKSTLLQFNTNYTAKRLTAQGYRLPTFVANIGLRHDLQDKKMAVVLTVSDLFDSLKERTLVDTPILHDEITRRRSSRVVYAGFIYNFGKPTKKSKDDALQYDNQP